MGDKEIKEMGQYILKQYVTPGAIFGNWIPTRTPYYDVPPEKIKEVQDAWQIKMGVRPDEAKARELAIQGMYETLFPSPEPPR